MAKYTEQEIQKALAENKKPEGMSSTYWSKLKRGVGGKCYGVGGKVGVSKKTPKAPVEPDPVPATESKQVSEPENDSEFTTTVVEQDGSVKIITSSEV